MRGVGTSQSRNDFRTAANRDRGYPSTTLTRGRARMRATLMAIPPTNTIAAAFRNGPCASSRRSMASPPRPPLRRGLHDERVAHQFHQQLDLHFQAIVLVDLQELIETVVA